MFKPLYYIERTLSRLEKGSIVPIEHFDWYVYIELLGKKHFFCMGKDLGEFDNWGVKLFKDRDLADIHRITLQEKDGHFIYRVRKMNIIEYLIYKVSNKFNGSSVEVVE